MERLKGIDAWFLYTETPTVHTHTLKIAVFEPVPGEEGDALARARAQIAAHLPLLPGFRRRVVEVPWGLHHPVWVEDPEFALERHVKREPVAPPGGPREMDAAISRVASRPLDRGRPLWEVWLLEGLAEGRTAAVVKIHHAMADGVAAAHLLAHVMGPIPEPGERPRDDWAPELLPSRRTLVWDALREHPAQAWRLLPLVGRTVARLAALLRGRRRAPVRPPLPVLDTPRTPFNTALTPERVFASALLSLDEVRAVARGLGVTVTDVMLALVAGSLRRYLAARGALPARPLVAEVPVATDAAGDPERLAGNRVSNLFTRLRTDLADPVERLRATHDVTEAAKRAHAVLGADLYAAWTDYAPPLAYAAWMRRRSLRHAADRERPAVNCIVSSVPGPRHRLYWDRAPLQAFYSVGPILDGIGLNVTLWSYLDSVHVGVLACPDRVDSVHEISEGLWGELQVLLAEVFRGGGRDAAPPRLGASPQA